MDCSQQSSHGTRNSYSSQNKKRKRDYQKDPGTIRKLEEEAMSLKHSLNRYKEENINFRNKLLQNEKEILSRDSHIKELLGRSRPQHDIIVKNREEARIVSGFKRKISDLTKEWKKIKDANEEIKSIIAHSKNQNYNLALNKSIEKCNRIKQVLLECNNQDDILAKYNISPENQCLSIARLVLESKELASSYQEKTKELNNIKKKGIRKKQGKKEEPSESIIRNIIRNSNEENKKDSDKKRIYAEEIKQLKDNVTQCKAIHKLNI